MKSCYKLAREEDIIPTLQRKLLNDRKWKDRLKEKIPCLKYSFTKGYGDQQRSVPLNELPPIFLILQQQKDIVLSSIEGLAVVFTDTVIRILDDLLTISTQKAPRGSTESTTQGD